VDLLWPVFEICARINYQHLRRLIVLEPQFMLIMDPLQVLQRYLAFLRPHPHPSPFITLLRTTPEIDDPRLFNFGHGLESGVQGFEDLVLSFVHIAEVVHQL